MEMQRIESESLKYAFSDFSVYFSDDLRYLRCERFGYISRAAVSV